MLSLTTLPGVNSLCTLGFAHFVTQRLGATSSIGTSAYSILTSTHDFASAQLTPIRFSALRTAMSLVIRLVSPCVKLTSTAIASVHVSVACPNSLGLRRSKAHNVRAASSEKARADDIRGPVLDGVRGDCSSLAHAALDCPTLRLPHACAGRIMVDTIRQAQSGQPMR